VAVAIDQGIEGPGPGPAAVRPSELNVATVQQERRHIFVDKYAGAKLHGVFFDFRRIAKKLQWLKGGYLSLHEVGVVGVTVCVMVLVFVFFRFSMIGLAMRAAAANPLSSGLLGINVGAMLGLGWGLAAAIGAVAGILTAPILYLDPNMMLNVVIYAFAGAVLGGINNPWGAVAGGFILGIAENLLGAFVIPPDLKLPSVLVVIIAIVTFKPEGLFGRRVLSRV